MKIPTPPEPFSFLIQNSLYSAAFPIIVLTKFPLNLVSCTQQISNDIYLIITTISPCLPVRIPTFTRQACQFAFLLFCVMSLDDGLTSYSCENNPTVCVSFSLKSYSPVYTV